MTERGWGALEQRVLPGRRGFLAVKRAFDICASLILLAALCPLLLAIGAAVRLDSPGPALFLQERMTRRGRRFTILKFRTMRTDAGEQLAVDEDARITRLGRKLRQSRLDELPQLWNVLVAG